MLALRKSMILHGFATTTSMLAQAVRGSRHTCTTIVRLPKCNQTNFLIPRRRNLSSVNPMFPVREIPDKHKLSEEADFLTRHGGKIAVGALSLTFYLLYTYYESGQSKNRVEEELNDQAAIEPYEVNEIRFLNTLTPELYDVLVEACMEHFSQHNQDINSHDSSSSSSSHNDGSSNACNLGPTALYPDFVVFVNGFLDKYNQEVLKSHRLAAANKPIAIKPVTPTAPFIASERFDGCKEGYIFTTGPQGLGYYRDNSSSVRGGRRGEGRGERELSGGGGGGGMVWIRAGHLFDRLVASHLLLTTSASSSSASSSAPSPTAADSANPITVAMKTVPVSVAFLLVALNMAERTAAPQRAGSLFRLASLLDQYQENHQQRLDNSSSNNSSSSSSSNSSSSGGSGGTVSASAVTTIIRYLGDTWQLPHEKRVVETGVKYPIKTYRRKTAEDTVTVYLTKRQKERKELAEKQGKESNSDSNSNSNSDSTNNVRGGLLPVVDDVHVNDTRLNQEEFQGLLLGSMVCAWAECYRHIP